MNKIKTMVNGIPGNVAVNVARHFLKDSRFEVIPYSLTGPEITDASFELEGLKINLIRPEKRNEMITTVKRDQEPFISVDYTHPSAVNSNAEFYCKNSLPFVMGTTGGDREALFPVVQNSTIAAVISPNMAKQIVGFQAMMAHAAEKYPDLFKGFSLVLEESHQHGKADTSGTAKAMVAYFNKLGIPFSESDIKKERDPETQEKVWGIPHDHLRGHAWHTYTLTSDDDTVKFVFQHNVNGRDIYAKGSIDAVLYLSGQVEKGAKGKVFTMIDVLKG